MAYAQLSIEDIPGQNTQGFYGMALEVYSPDGEKNIVGTEKIRSIASAVGNMLSELSIDPQTGKDVSPAQTGRGVVKERTLSNFWGLLRKTEPAYTSPQPSGSNYVSRPWHIALASELQKRTPWAPGDCDFGANEDATKEETFRAYWLIPKEPAMAHYRVEDNKRILESIEPLGTIPRAALEAIVEVAQQAA